MIAASLSHLRFVTQIKDIPNKLQSLEIDQMPGIKRKLAGRVVMQRKGLRDRQDFRNA
jgi:hypothetical protein